MASESQKAANASEIDRLALSLAKEPGSKAFIPLAEEYGKAGMWEEAVAVLEDGLKMYPSFITAMVGLGRAYDQLNQPVKAKAILEEAVKLSPENLRAHRTLAKIYSAQGDKEAALRSCNVILSVNPQDQEALSIRAILGEPAPISASNKSKRAEKKQKRQSSAQSADQTGEDGEKKSAHPSTVPSAPPLSEMPEEAVPAISVAEKVATPDPKLVVAAQLREWLTTIQARRRGASFSAPSKPGTS